MKDYTVQLASVVSDALDHINNYKGKRVITLADGSKALDNDDAWIIINREDEPTLRDKRVSDDSEDTYLLDAFSYEDICHLADALTA